MFRYGLLVSRNPLKVILLCLCAAALCGVGLLEFTEETNPFELWVPTGSDVVENNAWLQENFPTTARFYFSQVLSTYKIQPETIIYRT